MTMIELPSRRTLLRAASVLPFVLASSRLCAEEAFTVASFWDQPRTVWLKRSATGEEIRSATGEEIRSTYWADGALVQSEYVKLCWFLRDLTMEKRIAKLNQKGLKVPRGMYPAASMSLVLLDILYATTAWLEFHGIARPIWVTSGFRHPITNASIEGAALNSHHTLGGAGDIVIPGVNPVSVSAYGLWLSGGGVGWYPGKAFTHVDDGRLRFWKGK